MLIYSFICSIIFTIVMITFVVSSIFITIKQKKIDEEFKKEINGFEIGDLYDKTKEKE